MYTVFPPPLAPLVELQALISSAPRARAASPVNGFDRLM